MYYLVALLVVYYNLIPWHQCCFCYSLLIVSTLSTTRTEAILNSKKTPHCSLCCDCCYLVFIHVYVYVACNLRTCAVCRLHGAKYAVCRLHGTQSSDCMVTVQTKGPSKTCDDFSKLQRNLRFSARINFLTKLPNIKGNNLCLFDIGYYSFSCL